MRRRGAFLFPLLVLLAGASFIREAAVGWLVSAEEAWEGQLARRLTYLGKPPPVTLVEISDDTLSKHAWPWTAEDFGVFLQSALPATPGGKPFEPVVIGIEPVLDFERGALAGGERNVLHERALHDNIRRAPQLALGGLLGWSRELDSVQPLIPVPVLNRVRGDIQQLPGFTAVELWVDEDLRLAASPGWMNIPVVPGPRGLCTLVVRYRGQPVPTMPLQLTMMWAKAMPDEVEVVLGEYIVIGNKLRVPIDAQGRMQVNFGATPARVTYDNLQVARYQMDNGNPPMYPAETFHQKVMLLARTDATARKLDVPAGGRISAGELAAFAVATIQAQAHPTRIGVWFDWGFVGLLAVVAYWLPRWKTTRMALAVLVGEAAYIAGAMVLFRAQMFAVPGVLPLGLAVWMLLLRVCAKPMQKVIAF
jgi:hypothetical protein